MQQVAERFIFKVEELTKTKVIKCWRTACTRTNQCWQLLKSNADKNHKPRLIQYRLLDIVDCSKDEDSDRSQALSLALATFFRHVGFAQNNTLLERCQTFNAKDRKMFKFSKSSKKVTSSMESRYSITVPLLIQRCYMMLFTSPRSERVYNVHSKAGKTAVMFHRANPL